MLNDRYSDRRLRDLANEARGHYVAQRWVEALECNRELVRASIECGDSYGAIQGRRFEGLCLYRLDKWSESLAALEAAEGLASREGCVELGLYIANHKGATLRRLGRIPEALETFRTALRVARKGNAHEARTRLLGNLGALYDELGERERADDCYARYEELVERLDLPATRLANARGLAGRAARLRGDWEEARWRFDNEKQLGMETGDRGKQIDAACHQADLACDQGNWEQAEELVREAIALAGDMDRARIRRARRLAADIALLRNQLADAHDLQLVARREIDATQGYDHLALLRSEAELARRAGLHGAALDLLVDAVATMRRLYTGFDDPVLGKLGNRRVTELRDLAEALSVEARQVDRTPEERYRVESALAEVLGEGAPERPSIDLWTWTDEARTKAERLWRQLLGARFDLLLPDSRRDLIRAELAYHGAIDDLERTAHLLALVVERELRERFVAPLLQRLPPEGIESNPAVDQARERGMKTSLGGMQNLLAWVTNATRTGPSGAVFDYFHAHRATLTDIGVAFMGIRVADDAPALDLAQVRNQVAHGRGGRALTRAQVDAIKRHLVLQAPRPLARLTDLPLPPS